MRSRFLLRLARRLPALAWFAGAVVLSGGALRLVDVRGLVADAPTASVAFELPSVETEGVRAAVTHVDEDVLFAPVPAAAFSPFHDESSLRLGLAGAVIGTAWFLGMSTLVTFLLFATPSTPLCAARRPATDVATFRIRPPAGSACQAPPLLKIR